MTATLEDIEELFEAVKVLRDERKKMAKLSHQAFQAEGPKAQQKANVELNWQAFQVGRLEHKAHAAAVNAGVAEARAAERYAPYTVKLSGFHEYEVVPPLPRCMTPEPHPEPTPA